MGKMRVAIGLKARTGRAIVVAVSGSPEPRVLARTELRLLPQGDFAPYHAAENLSPTDAQASVDRSIAAARRLAEEGIRAVVAKLMDDGHEVCACGALVGPGIPPWTTADIVAVHVRMHQAEGELFRSVLLDGASACGFAVTTLREKTVLDDSASRLGFARPELDRILARLGKTIGAPWGKDQKEAAAVALVALGETARATPAGDARPIS
jgi:hypothetical protein